MSVETVQTLINSFGFPIVCCIGLGAYIWFTQKQNRDREKERDEKMYEEIRYNREVNAKLLATNQLLANDIKSELKEIKFVVKGDN